MTVSTPHAVEFTQPSRVGRFARGSSHAVLGAALFAALAVQIAGAGRSASMASPGAQVEALTGLTGAQTIPDGAIAQQTIVAFYGSPLTPDMGILGEGSPAVMAQDLRRYAAEIDAHNGAGSVLPAFHLLYATVQDAPMADGSHLQRLDDATVRQFIDLARENGFAVILDVQLGRSSPLAEARRIERYLSEPDVFLALDPEWALAAGEAPGDRVGSVDGVEVDAVSAYLAEIVRAHALPPKILVVHQFTEAMVANRASIQRRKEVEVVISADGIGSVEMKRIQYERLIGSQDVARGGIKMFLSADDAVMGPADLFAINPKPSFILYH